MMNPIKVLVLLISCSFFAGCWSRPEIDEQIPFQISDPNLTMQLVSSGSDISTPIGLAVDARDNLYVLESHTHTPPEDYTGPAFDLIKRGVDQDGDGIPESWQVYADSLEDGMNLAFGPDGQLFVTTKNAVWEFNDLDGDGVSDQRKLILDMLQPEFPYDHAAILGLAVSPDHSWLFVSRGNTGSDYWVIQGTDGSSISGYGDGGNVMRCRLDGSELEEIATGFWNPFDIKFTLDGRLMLTDNDPDSRGPNRLIEIVPGGDYGYKSLYGGSGLSPYVAWNGELPGTLPYAAPLGEAPCALLDAGFTSFGLAYQKNILASIWEEKNIVKIPLSEYGSSVTGNPEVLIQGDSSFHPVALAANSKGELYITDWVVREYPNHGEGRIWRLIGPEAITGEEPTMNAYKFSDPGLSFENYLELLSNGDLFEKASARFFLNQDAEDDRLMKLIQSSNPELRLQAVLLVTKRRTNLSNEQVSNLLKDNDQEVRKAVLIYLGTTMSTAMLHTVESALEQGLINSGLFELYLATIENLQPDFVQEYQKNEGKSNQLERKLPDDFIYNIIRNDRLDERIRALALPHLKNIDEHSELLLDLLSSSRETTFQLSLMDAIKGHTNIFSSVPGVEQALLTLVMDHQNSDRVRSHAIAILPAGSSESRLLIKRLLDEESEVLQYAAIKYLIQNADDSEREEIDQWIESGNSILTAAVKTVWRQSVSGTGDYKLNEWFGSVDGKGNQEVGELVFKSASSICQTCHKINGWGGTFGPDLSHVGSSKNQQQLIDAVLYPSLEIAPEWQGWYVIDKDGNRHTGRQIDMHLNRVELMNIQGDFDNFPEPKSFGVLTESLMPAGLQNSMTLDEFNDLMAYLVSLK